MRRLAFIITASLFLLSCEKNSDNTQQEYLFGLQLSSHQLSFDYINMNSCEITNHSLPIQSGILFRGTFDGLNNYYASVGDTIYEINITENNIIRKFTSPDTLLYIFSDIDKNLLIGVSINNDTVGIYKLSLTTENQSFIKTGLISNSASFVTDVVYNTNDETLIIKIGNVLNTINIDNGEKISGFMNQNIIHGLRFLKSDNCLHYIEFSDNKLYYKKCDLNGDEKYSNLLETDIVGFYADNFVLTDKNEYVFIAMDIDQKAKLYRIDSKGINKKELINYDAVFGFSYIKK